MPSPDKICCWTFAGWESDRTYQRKGRSGTFMLGNGAWVQAWRKRLVSDETIKFCVDNGINILVTEFYKGFGLAADSSEWPRLKDFILRAHEQGLKIIGYTQGNSIYYETLLAERPDAIDWFNMDYDGRFQTWAGIYYRRSPCLTSEGYLEYMKHVVKKGVTELGLDGFHLDNSYYRHCWCSRCQEKFRKMLADLPDLKLRLGLETAKHIQAPPLPANQTVLSDPLQLLWIEFGVQARLNFLGNLCGYARQIKPDVMWASNPAFPRENNSMASHAFDPSREAGVCDMIFAENGNLPQIHDGRIITQNEAYLYADAGGYSVFNTTWDHPAPGVTDAAGPKKIWPLAAEEFSYHAAIMGTNWMLRPSCDGDGMLCDDAARLAEWQSSRTFFRKLYKLAYPKQLRQWGQIGVLVSPKSNTWCKNTDSPATNAILNELLRRRIPNVLVFAGKEIPACVKYLLVFQQSCLSDGEMRIITDFAAKNGQKVLIAGTSGWLDGTAVPRNASDWKKWLASEGFISTNMETALNCQQAPTKRDGYFSEEIVAASKVCMETLDELFSLGEFRPEITLEAHDDVFMNVEYNSASDFLVHLRVQSGRDDSITGVKINCYGELSRLVDFSQFTPDGQNLTGVQRYDISAVHGQATLQLELKPFRKYSLIKAKLS